ncbi:uncharacterized protein EDB93DRAFT_1104430 [Suillus bovinus]|uniref:uncharacterized protein n=1 Tax=Suillus bovinus TaxID=48563 RepID=UPI001B85C716|nr:uncharacterized protein EDB93DRAFT_1104430 [Suillus bovinus]KAG2146451.1 hypothetical protein EDB93DRAFT_1104430 [Suillus bovinus]
MPPKVSASHKHTRITKKCPLRKNKKAIKKPGKNSGLKLSLNSDASQIGVCIEQPQPPASYQQLISLIDSEGMDEDEDEDEMEEKDEMEEDNEHCAQPGPLQAYQQPFRQPSPSYNYHPSFMQPTPPPDSRQLQQQHLGQPGPSHNYHPPFIQPGSLPDSWQLQQQSAPYPHTYGLPQVPIPFIPPELMSHEACQSDVPTPTTFRNIRHMQERQREEERTRYLGHLPINLPGICKVFVYDPCCLPKGHWGQLFPTRVIRCYTDKIPSASCREPQNTYKHFRKSWKTSHYFGQHFRSFGQPSVALDKFLGTSEVVSELRTNIKEVYFQYLVYSLTATGDITITVPLPSQKDLPLVSTLPSPITLPVAVPRPVANSSARSHPYAPQCLTNKRFKTMMEGAKSNVHHKVILENAMPEMGINMAMAEAALLTAHQDFMPDMEIPNYQTCLKTL